MASEHGHKIAGAVRKLRAVMEAFDMKGTNRATMLNAINTINALRTRPAPAATDTGLVRYDLSIFGNGIVEMGGGAYVRADQAEELLAAERDKVIVQTKRAELTEMKERWLKEMVAAITSNPIGSPKHFRAVEDARRALNNPEASLYALYEKEELIQRVEKAEADNAALIHDLNRIKDHETELVNDNAAKDARIKELDRCHEGTIDLCNQKTAQIKALEAKLAAAEKALEFYANQENWKNGRFEQVDGGTVLRHYPASAHKDRGATARAVLGGKPS